MITVSAAQPGDVPAIVGLLEELGRHYGVPQTEARGRRMGEVSETLFGSPPTAHALLARDEDEGLVAGLAAYSFLWPAVGTGRSLFLKELYVAAGYRRQGVGKALMRAVFETATALGCVRVEWTTDPGNAAAQAFYAGLGLATHPKVFYRAEPWTSLL